MTSSSLAGRGTGGAAKALRPRAAKTAKVVSDRMKIVYRILSQIWSNGLEQRFARRYGSALQFRRTTISFGRTAVSPPTLIVEGVTGPARLRCWRNCIA